MAECVKDYCRHPREQHGGTRSDMSCRARARGWRGWWLRRRCRCTWWVGSQKQMERIVAAGHDPHTFTGRRARA